MGRLTGILAPSVLFASLHIIGMNFSLFSCVQVMVAGTMVGVMFSLIALEGRSVWNSAIVHGVWNMIIIGGGLTIGTEINEYSVCSYVLETRAFLLTGGEFWHRIVGGGDHRLHSGESGGGVDDKTGAGEEG